MPHRGRDPPGVLAVTDADTGAEGTGRGVSVVVEWRQRATGVRSLRTARRLKSTAPSAERHLRNGTAPVSSIPRRLHEFGCSRLRQKHPLTSISLLKGRETLEGLRGLRDLLSEPLPDPTAEEWRTRALWFERESRVWRDRALRAEAGLTNGPRRKAESPSASRAAKLTMWSRSSVAAPMMMTTSS